MRRPEFHADSLTDLLRQEHIVTMPQLKKALGTVVDMTVFRKLREIDYLTSYSHRGRFYTLTEIVRFDEQGLWSHKDVHFSRHGTLVETVLQLVKSADSGYFAGELASLLHVAVKEPLLDLVRKELLKREEVSHLYLYCSADPAKRRQQLLSRKIPSTPTEWSLFHPRGQDNSDEARHAIALFFSLLNERQRRLYAGLESLRLGRGGDRQIAVITGMDAHTVAKGRLELLSGKQADTERLRRPGAGRKAVEKKRH